jgi:CheY-like chemotaxis protein
MPDELRSRYVRRGRGRVLLAEDDADLRDGFRAALEREGYAVLVAADGHEMLRLFSAAAGRTIAPPDVIVMDVRMPRHSGVELLTALRLAEWPVPVVLVTGFADDRARARAAQLKAYAVLEKPITASELVQVVRDAAESGNAFGGATP